jgi:pimeloyl-ACP methyl ester carboxylesterase
MMPSSAKPSRRILRRTVAVIIVLLAILSAFVAAVLAPYYLSVHIAQTSLLTLAALVTFGLIAWLGMHLGAALWRTNRLARLAAMTSGVLTLVFFIALYLLILRPVPPRYTDVIPADNAKSWRLPTGSIISYQEFLPPSGVAEKPEPVVFIHGGPGARFAPFDSDAYGSLAADGFRVYLYDQAGSGASALLPHIKDYSIARSVEDLEAIRLELHAEQMILIGHSWGSMLAAHYMAKYPTHVSKVVFNSPGALANYEGASVDMSRTDVGPRVTSLPPLRLLAGLLLMEKNPDAAEQLLPQREAEEMTGPFLMEVTRFGKTLVCKGDSAKIPALIAGIKDQPDNPGFNGYVSDLLLEEASTTQADPRAALRGNKTPAILLYGECNYLAWNGAVDYRKTYANLKIFYIPKAGHYIQFEQPELMKKVIRNFLLDQPDAIPPYTNDADPRLSTAN